MGIESSRAAETVRSSGTDLRKGVRMEMNNRRVIVYIWKSKFLGGRGNSGHVAVEVTRSNEHGTMASNTFISFWPQLKLDERWPEEKARPRFFTDEQKYSFILDYTGDRLFQKRKPEYIFCFYTLETSDIMRAFQLFKNTECAWGRLGQYTPKLLPGTADYETAARIEKEQSCVSLACLTLDAGNINHLIGLQDAVWASSTGTTAVSADNSAESYQNLKFVQPSKNTMEYVKRALVSGYYMSPDILVERLRLKIAKRREWNVGENVRKMGRMTYVTQINAQDSSDFTMAFSFQDPEDPTGLQDQPIEEQYAVNEISHEWLPIDE